uniref:Netrin receptor UNC5A-D-like N-terminal domain-containing protein n=1 Tax=Anopheles melas TaxID=34690 RepID=A0A182UBW9_9DIPT
MLVTLFAAHFFPNFHKFRRSTVAEELYFICTVGLASPGGLETKEHRRSDYPEHVSAVLPRKDTALEQYKSPPFDGNSQRQSPFNRQAHLPPDAGKRWDVPFNPAPDRESRKSHESLIPYATVPKGELHAVRKSENNHAEMKLAPRQRPGSDVIEKRDDDDDDGDGDGDVAEKPARMLDDRRPVRDDDVVDAAKDEYYDAPTREEHEGDNYEDGFGKCAWSGSVIEHPKGSASVRGSKVGKALGGAAESNGAEELDADDDEEEEEEEEEEDENDSEVSYGEDVLPPSEAFGTFGERTGGGLKVEEAPYFLVEPQNTYVIRSKPAVLKCKAANTLQIHFKCSGSIKPPPSIEESHVDPHSGVHFQEVTATISRDLVYEYFGKLPFKCECHAWSPRGKAVSQPASIVVACKYRWEGPRGR